MLVEPTPHNLRKGCAGERSLSRRSMGFCLACPPCTSCDASSLAPYLPPRSTGGTYPTCARPMDTCKPRPTGTSCSPSRPTVASSRSISKSAGTSSTHSLQAVPIRSPTAQDKLHACAYELHAYACRLSSYGCRYLDSQFCAPLHALRASMGAGVAEKMLRARAYYSSEGRKGGVMTWRLLHPRSC